MLLDVASLKGRVILPTPVIAEFLVRTDEATTYWLVALETKSSTLVAASDRRDALESALIERGALARGDKRGGRKDPYQ
jgi:hypothetical protein